MGLYSIRREGTMFRRMNKELSLFHSINLCLYVVDDGEWDHISPFFTRSNKLPDNYDR
jgi:hypothetical protein